MIGKVCLLHFDCQVTVKDIEVTPSVTERWQARVKHPDHEVAPLAQSAPHHKGVIMGMITGGKKKIWYFYNLWSKITEAEDTCEKKAVTVVLEKKMKTKREFSRVILKHLLELQYITCEYCECNIRNRAGQFSSEIHQWTFSSATKSQLIQEILKGTGF